MLWTGNGVEVDRSVLRLSLSDPFLLDSKPRYSHHRSRTPNRPPLGVSLLTVNQPGGINAGAITLPRWFLDVLLTFGPATPRPWTFEPPGNAIFGSARVTSCAPPWYPRLS